MASASRDAAKLGSGSNLVAETIIRDSSTDGSVELSVASASEFPSLDAKWLGSESDQVAETTIHDFSTDVSVELSVASAGGFSSRDAEKLSSEDQILPAKRAGPIQKYYRIAYESSCCPNPNEAYIPRLNQSSLPAGIPPA